MIINDIACEWNNLTVYGTLFGRLTAKREALPREQENNTVAEIGNPEKRRVLVPHEMPAPERVVPEPTSPVKVPEKQPA